MSAVRKRKNQTRKLLEASRDIIRKLDDLSESQVEASICVADLAHSTTYKATTDPARGLLKAITFNDIATERIVDNGGQIVKYIGDAVMGLFKGDAHEEKSLRAAVTIQLALREHNRQRGYRSDEERLFARVALHAGKVHMIKYRKHDEPDPQGLDVDLTFRLEGLATAGQILCSTRIKERGVDSGYTISKPVKRELRGISEDIPVCEVDWGTGVIGIGVSPHVPRKSSQLGESLLRAWSLEVQRRPEDALKEYKRAYDMDQRFYVPMWRMAQILTWDLERHDEAWEWNEKAWQRAPNSYHVKYLRANLLWKRHQRDEVPNEILEEILHLTNEALEQAQTEMDQHATRTLQNNKSYYQWLKYRRMTKERRNQNRGMIDEAIESARVAVAEIVNRIQDKQLIEFRDTYAMVLGARGKAEDLEEAIGIMEGLCATHRQKYPILLVHLAGLIEQQKALALGRNKSES